MEAAVAAGVQGIEAECGGACACATCHVYVDEAWIQRVGIPVGIEDEMLDCAESPRGPTSRLACQINVCEKLDGLVVQVPGDTIQTET